MKNLQRQHGGVWYSTRQHLHRQVLRMQRHRSVQHQFWPRYRHRRMVSPTL